MGMRMCLPACVRGVRACLSGLPFLPLLFGALQVSPDFAFPHHILMLLQLIPEAVLLGVLKALRDLEEAVPHVCGIAHTIL